MKYRVVGTVKFAVEVFVEADNKDEAEMKAMDRFDEGTLDSFKLLESIDDNEVDSVTPIEEAI